MTRRFNNDYHKNRSFLRIKNLRIKTKKAVIALFLTLILFLVTAGFLFLKSTLSISKLLEIGEKAHSFELKDTHGEEHSLSDYTGKKIYLIFFKTDCKYCLKQLANINKISYKTNDSFKIVAISESGFEKTLEFENTYSLNFPILIDDKDVYKKYKSNGFPTIYLLDDELKVRYARVGFRSLDLDEKILTQNEMKNKIPIEIYSDVTKEHFTLDDSGRKAMEIALNDPIIKEFMNANIADPGQKRVIISHIWLDHNNMDKWIIHIVEPPCNCSRGNSGLNMAKIEIDPFSKQIVNLEITKNLSVESYKEKIYKEIIGSSTLDK